MRIQTESEAVESDKNRVDRSLRSLSGRLQVLENTRKDAMDRNRDSQKTNLAVTHEYSANLKVRMIGNSKSIVII